jgi:hypothetical protein
MHQASVTIADVDHLGGGTASAACGEEILYGAQDTRVNPNRK